MQSHEKVYISHTTGRNVDSGIAASNCDVQIRIRDMTCVKHIVSLSQIGKV